MRLICVLCVLFCIGCGSTKVSRIACGLSYGQPVFAIEFSSTEQTALHAPYVGPTVVR